MLMSDKTRKIATLLVGAALVGCASLGRGSTASAERCYPNQCLLEVQNDYGQLIAVGYFDSTGVGDALGSVRPLSVQFFALTRRTSREVTVQVTYDGHVYRTNAHLALPPIPNLVHFPTDFKLASAQ